MTRVPLLRSTDAEGRVAEALADLEEAGRDLDVLRAVANASGLFRPFLRYSGALMFGSTTPDRTRELIILHIAALLGHAYEWAEHERFARTMDVTDDEIATLAEGRVPATLDDHERLSLAVAAAVTAGLPEAPALLDEARAALGPERFVELACIVSWWGGCLPPLIEMLELRP